MPFLAACLLPDYLNHGIEEIMEFIIPAIADHESLKTARQRTVLAVENDFAPNRVLEEFSSDSSDSEKLLPSYI